MSRAAGRSVDGTARGSVTSAQDQTGSLILVTIPVINPALTVGTTALVGEGGGIQKVLYINVGQVHAQTLANLLSLAAWDARIHHHKITADMRTYLDRTLFLLMMLVVMRMMMFTATVHANAANTMAIGTLDDNNADIMPSGQEGEAAMTPVSLHLRVIRIAAVAGTTVKDRMASVSEKHTIVIDGKAVTRTVQVGNVHGSVAVQVKHDRRDAANVAKGKVHPATIDGQVPNGSLNLIDQLGGNWQGEGAAKESEARKKRVHSCLLLVLFVDTDGRVTFLGLYSAPLYTVHIWKWPMVIPFLVQ